MFRETKIILIILFLVILAFGLWVAYLNFWPIEQLPEPENPNGPSATSTEPNTTSTEPIGFEIFSLLEEALENALGEDYKIFIEQGQCGETIAVKYNGLEMHITEAALLEWSVPAIEKAVVVRQTDQGYETMFLLDRFGMIDDKGRINTGQPEAKYGYGFQVTKDQEAYWIFDFVILNQEGRTASELASFYWDKNQCGYAILISGQPIAR